jgi:glutaconate CoA-transferase subunit A
MPAESAVGVDSADKVMTMAQAVATFVSDGDSLYIAGFSHAIAMAAGHEIIRQRKRGLTLCRATPDIIYDQMVAAGCCERLVFSWLGNPGLGGLHCINRALSAGLGFEEYSHYGMMARLVAGASGLPFYTLPAGTGGALADYNPAYRTIVSPYTNDRWVTVPPLRPDVTFIHVQRSDRAGNAQLWGIVGDIKEAAFAARRVIVSVEELVDSATVRRDPNRTVLPGYLVHAVVAEPWGAHPSSVQGFYDRDNEAYREWATLSRDPSEVERYLDQWVFGVSDRAGYVRAHDRALNKLLPGKYWSEPVNYGTT